MQFVNAKLVLPDSIIPGTLRIRNGRIHSMSRDGSRISKQANSIGDVNLNGDYLAPGFVDLHIHGALGRDTMEGTRDAFQTITQFHLTGGTTSIALTTVTASGTEIERVLSAAKPLHGKSVGGSRIVGVHIEGPYISKEKPGVQDLRYIRPPDSKEWRKWLKYGSLITQMTIAPEHKGVIPLIQALRRNGSIVSGGHTNSTEIELEPALKAGLNHATHTFNCMSTASKRGHLRIAGMLEFSLAHPEICCELIADGQHVRPTLMRMLLNAKGIDRVCLITDAMAGAGLKIGTEYRAGGPDAPMAKVTPDAALTVDGTALAGSTLTMIEAVRRVIDFGGVTLPEAVRMASLVPAIQLRKHSQIGSLEPGKRADFVHFDRHFRIKGVWLDGEQAFFG